MQRPRRTTECETPSARQSRPSRLQQPIRRASTRDGSLTRSSSVEPASTLGVGGNHLIVPSSTNRQRSSSFCNARTPQKTPLGFTPSKANQFTGDKQRPMVNDKRWLQEQVVRITEYLKAVDSGVNVDFLHRGGLKTMSIKQFIALVNFFLKFVTGNKFSVGSNHVESISKILNQIDYPYTMNKSWLKTPTAPHAFNNVVMLFSYFMDFIPPSDNVNSFKKDYLVVSEEFLDMEFALKLFGMAENGFALWNYQKNEEFEKLQSAALDEFIFKKVSIPGCNALEEEIKRINSDLDKIISKKAIIKDEEEYFRLDKEVKTNQRKIANLQKAREDNQKTYEKLESQLNLQVTQIKKIEMRVNEIRKVVETQEVSVEERNQLIEEVGQMEYILKTKKQAVCELQEMDHQKQILLSRQIKQLTEKIAKFNSYIRQVMFDFEDLDVDIESLCLHQNSKVELEDQLSEVTVFLRRLQKHIGKRMSELSEQCEGHQNQIKLITYEIDEWIEPKTKEVMECVKEQQRKIDELEREIIATENHVKYQVNEFAQEAKKANAAMNLLRKTIDESRKELHRVGEENEAMMAVVKERFENVFTIRSRQLKRFHDALQVLQKKCLDAKEQMKSSGSIL